MTELPDLSLAFHEGQVRVHHDHPDESETQEIVLLMRHCIADLVVPTGRVVACDPLGEVRDAPFARRVPPGRYPIYVTIVHRKESEEFTPGGDSAFAVLQLRDGHPERWEIALCEGRAADDWRDFYCVDSGVGCFMDVEARDTLTRLMRDDPRFNPPSRDETLPFIRALYLTPNPLADEIGIPCVDFPLDTESGLNCVMFTTGRYGDGDYTSYWGLDRHDVPLCLVTNFDALSL